MNTSDSIVIIPTYNEKENMEKIVRAVFSLDKCFHILVIDDGMIVQQGTHAALSAVPGKYKDFIDIRKRSEGWNIAQPPTR